MKISKEEICSYIKRWNENKQYVENRKNIESVFEESCKTDNKMLTVFKVAIIDSRYNTHLKSIDDAAKSIASVKNLDKRLKIGDPSVVNELVTKHGVSAVFASKYCHFSNPEKYPINDGNVRAVFVEYFGIPKYRLERIFKKDYQNVLDYFERFKKEVYSDNYKELDKYLWIKGTEIKKGKK